MEATVEQFAQRLESAADLVAIEQVVGEEARRRGFARFCYHMIQPPEGPRRPFFLGSYPPEWSAHYIEQDFVNRDPVISAVPQEIMPFRWDSLQVQLRRRGRDAAVLDQAGDFGLRRGITVPLHGPGRGIADMNLTADQDLPDQEFDRLWREQRNDLHLISLYAHQAILQRYLNDTGDLPQLAPRERECLLWTARGKTAWEVGEILGISQDTVTGYLKTATHKMGVFSKTHAVVKAVLQGLIVP